MTDPVNHSDDHADHTFEYWAGNPSVEIIHGHIKVSGSRSSESSDTNATSASTSRGLAHRSHRSDSPESCMALASSVPCHMSASELCDFLGAFGADTHRRFRHCRVLHGRNSEDYLIALLMASPQDVDWLILSWETVQCHRTGSLQSTFCCGLPSWPTSGRCCKSKYMSNEMVSCATAR